MYRLIIVDDEFEIRNGLSRYFPWESVGFEAAAVFENARGAGLYPAQPGGRRAHGH